MDFNNCQVSLTHQYKIVIFPSFHGMYSFHWHSSTSKDPGDFLMIPMQGTDVSKHIGTGETLHISGLKVILWIQSSVPYPTLLTHTHSYTASFYLFIYITGVITSLSFYKKTHMFSSSSDGTIGIWQVGKWECLRTLRGHKYVFNIFIYICMFISVCVCIK